MKTDIMTATQRFVITNTKRLISPKGYDHTQPVYVQPKIAIHCNEIPDKSLLPKNVKLYVHDILKITTGEIE